MFNTDKNQSNSKGPTATPESTVGVSQSTSQRTSFPLKPLVMLVVALILIVLGTIAYNRYNSSKKSSATTVCNDDRLNNLSGVLASENVSLLMPLAEEIQKLPNYDQDPNCLNAVTTYYIHISDSKNARIHLDKLESVYKEDVGFSSKLGNDAKTIETLRLNVSFLDEQQKQMLEGGVIPSPKVEQ